ncbi:MAG: ribonuclease HII [Candidatus Woesearchaeota archaeon]
MVLICGVEEAGRGPVIGPMVVCGVLIDKSKEHELAEMGVKDSKLLTPKQREELFSKIGKVAEDFCIDIVKPKEIDRAVIGDESNLNWLTADKFIQVINTLKPDIAYVDCPSTNTRAFLVYLSERILSEKTKLVVENKADKNYVVVGAASIMAKVTRDREIEKIKRKYNIEFGSGYPADPFTKQFLVNNYNKYPIFRESWASWKNVAKQGGQRKLNQF